MVSIHSLNVEGFFFLGIELELPGASFFVVANEVGYITSASFTVCFSSKESQGTTVAATIGEVTSLDEFLQAPLQEVTDLAQDYGWKKGMSCREALLKIA